MTTECFIKKVDGLGYKIRLSNKNVTKKKEKILISIGKHPFAWVFVNIENSLRIFDTNNDLFELIIEYAQTPLNERNIR